MVEADADINKLLCRILEGAGYDCRPAFSGSEAMLWAERYDYDLALLDLMLPGLSGEEVIAQLRRKKTMPILVLSAKAALEDRVNVLRLGADDILPKPIDTAEVLARGGQELLLVPEIALTAQLVDRLRQVFGERVIAYHSKLTDRERTELYLRLRDSAGGELVIGARSAIFLPRRRLERVVVDEELDPSYKQTDPAPRYQARDCAVLMT